MVVVMAHPKRRSRAYRLAAKLDAEIVWDRGEGLWDTAKRAWLTAQPNEHGYLTVIQDDAIPSEGFRDNLDRILAHTYPHPVSWYFGTGRPKPEVTRSLAAQAVEQEVSWIEGPGPWWGVAVSIHTDHIPGLLAMRTKTKSDDGRYTLHFSILDIPCLYTWPSLVDHAQIPSLAGPGQRGVRRAHRIGDATTFDPTGRRLVVERRRR